MILINGNIRNRLIYKNKFPINFGSERKKFISMVTYNKEIPILLVALGSIETTRLIFNELQ